MDSQNQTRENKSPDTSLKNVNYWKWLTISLVGAFVLVQLFDINITPRFIAGTYGQTDTAQKKSGAELAKEVLPTAGTILPAVWGDLGKKMVETGVIDKDKFESLYAQRGGMDAVTLGLLTGEDNGKLEINTENANSILNLLWAFGLSNKNRILEEGPMMDPTYGGADRFASTGGWPLSKGGVMDHYSTHSFVTLTGEQQQLVEKVSKNIYRPCCGNAVHFPDCNHGMAMLGLLELLASQGASEQEMYKVALQVNAYWFPDTYMTIAEYFNMRGVSWSDVEPKVVLGSAYSSAQGYAQVLSEVEPVGQQGGGSCGV